MSKRLLLPQVAFDFIFQTFPDFFFLSGPHKSTLLDI